MKKNIPKMSDFGLEDSVYDDIKNKKKEVLDIYEDQKIKIEEVREQAKSVVKGFKSVLERVDDSG